MIARQLGYAASLMLVVLAACSGTNRVVTLQHSETGETVTCEEERWVDQSAAKQSKECVSSFVITCRVEPSGHIDRKRKLEACIRARERDGYVVIEDSAAEEK